MSLDKVEQFESASGIGVHGIVGGRRLALGNVTLMAQEGIALESSTELAERAEAPPERRQRDPSCP
jgi:Cu+-exporting ATPase